MPRCRASSAEKAATQASRTASIERSQASPSRLLAPPSPRSSATQVMPSTAAATHSEALKECPQNDDGRLTAPGPTSIWSSAARRSKCFAGRDQFTLERSSSRRASVHRMEAFISGSSSGSENRHGNVVHAPRGTCEVAQVVHSTRPRGLVRFSDRSTNPRRRWRSSAAMRSITGPASDRGGPRAPIRVPGKHHPSRARQQNQSH